jgi:hypothetical protein
VHLVFVLFCWQYWGLDAARPHTCYTSIPIFFFAFQIRSLIYFCPAWPWPWLMIYLSFSPEQLKLQSCATRPSPHSAFQCMEMNAINSDLGNHWLRPWGAKYKTMEKLGTSHLSLSQVEQVHLKCRAQRQPNQSWGLHMKSWSFILGGNPGGFVKSLPSYLTLSPVSVSCLDFWFCM